MTTPSIHESRNVFVHNTTTFQDFRIRGEHAVFTVDPPVTCERGHYRVDLDFETHTASFSLISLGGSDE